MGPEDLQVADEVLAQVRAATLDKAMKRLQNEEGVSCSLLYKFE